MLTCCNTYFFLSILLEQRLSKAFFGTMLVYFVAMIYVRKILSILTEHPQKTLKSLPKDAISLKNNVMRSTKRAEMSATSLFTSHGMGLMKMEDLSKAIIKGFQFSIQKI